MSLPPWAFWLTLAVMFIGLAGTLLPAVPGVELIWLAALVYAAVGRFSTVDPLTFGILTLLGALGLTVEIWAGHLGSKLGGASWRSLLAGLLLGALGFVLGLFLSGVGAFLLGLVGTLTGILLVEYLHRRDWRQVARAGAGWLAGCLVSGVIRLGIGLLMVALFVWKAYPYR